MTTLGISPARVSAAFPFPFNVPTSIMKSCTSHIVILLLQASSIAADVPRIPLLLYDFHSDNCDRGICQNDGSLPDSQLARNASTTAFVRGNVGIEALETEGSDFYGSRLLIGSAERLVKYKQEKGNDLEPGISIGLWLRPLDEGRLKTPILTFGARELEEKKYKFTECDKSQIDLQLQVYSRSLSVVFRTSDTFYEPCQKLRMETAGLVPGSLMHVAIVLSDHHQQVFVDGELMSSMNEPFDSNLAHWNKHGILELFSYHNQPTWHGNLYRLEVSNGVWSQSDVRTIMKSGLAPADPVIFNQTHRIYEDAEIIPESHSAESYQEPNVLFHGSNNTIPTINLTVSFLDEEVSTLLQSKGIAGNNYPPLVNLYIVTPPKQGELFYLDGTRISSASSIVSLSDQQLIYVPAYNGHSELPGMIFDAFRYCFARSNIFVRSQCEAFADVAIVVDEVNDPPIALVAGDQPFTFYEGTQEVLTPILLQGSDVDKGDSISCFEVVSPPRNGYLYLSVPLRRSDHLFHGTLLSDLNYTIPGPEALVEYHYTGEALVREDLIVDSFEFRVRDNRGGWSMPTKAMIIVRTGLTGMYRSQMTWVKEDDNAFSLLQGEDHSGLDRELGFFVYNVPPPEDVTLFDNEMNPIHEGSMIAGVSAPIILQAHGRLCDHNEESTTSFGFHVYARDAERRIVSISDASECVISVQCRVKPIGLVVPQGIVQTRASSRLWGDPYGEHGCNEREAECLLPFSNSSVDLNEMHIDRASVVIKSNVGMLTLNPNHRVHLRLLEDQAVTRPTIQFKAPPSQLDGIMKGVVFQSRQPGIGDIHISIEYGDCQAPNRTLFECYRVEKTVQVLVSHPKPSEQEMLFDSFPWIPLPFTLTMLLLVKFKGKLRVLLVSHKKDFVPEEAATVAESAAIRWQQFYDEATGFYYYLDLDGGTVTWDVPLDEQFIPWEDYNSE